MDPEAIRRRAEQYERAMSLKARKEQIEKEKQLIEDERKRLQAQAIEQIGKGLSEKEAIIDLLRELPTIDEMREQSAILFDFIIDNANIIVEHYHEQATDYVTKIVLAISENPYAEYNVLDESAIHAVSIKSHMDRVTQALNMDPIDIQWMDTDNDREVAEQIALEQLRPLPYVRADWMKGLSKEQIRRILG